MSGELWFYHLERSSLEDVLPELLEKTLARGWRALVRSPDARRREALDQWLWAWRDDSFTPHGQAGEGHDERQPILAERQALGAGRKRRGGEREGEIDPALLKICHCFPPIAPDRQAQSRRFARHAPHDLRHQQ